MFETIRLKLPFCFILAASLFAAGTADSQTSPAAPATTGSSQTGYPDMNPAVEGQSQRTNPSSLDSTSPQRQFKVTGREDSRKTEKENDRDKEPSEKKAAIRPQPRPTAFQLKATEVFHALPPIFGSSFFHSPDSFTPPQDVQVPANYVIAPGDEIIVHIWGPITLDRRITVDRAGRIYVPQVGDIQVAGTSFSELETRIKNSVDRYFQNYKISVELGQLRSIQVFVTGEAVRPGSYTISSFSTLINALFLSGGPSPQGSYRKIELRRGSETVSTIDLYQFLRYGDKTKDARLLPGDVIFIPPVGRQVAVGSSVKVPGIYELIGDETIADVLALAGGPTNTAASATPIMVERTLDNDKHIALYIHLSEASQTATHNGDIISVPEVLPVYDKTVTLRGNVLTPGRFTWHPSMKISEVIPDKEALLTRDYWTNRNKLVQLPQFEPLISGRRHTVGIAGSGITADGKAPVPTYSTATPAEEQSTDSTTDGHEDVPAAHSSSDEQSAIQTESTHAVVVRIPAPDIDWSYAVIERTDPKTLKSTLIPFNLGKVVLDHDASADQNLLPGDIITIFSQGDITVARHQQTKYVRIEGEVEMAGIYSVSEGETLQALIHRAGGLTPNAYLFGAQFLRESARLTQQQRLDEYVQRLTAELQHSMINLSLNGGASNATGVTAASNELLKRISRQRATGRIVLTTTPLSNTADDLPSLQLEDGDVLIIPARPATIGVIGAVNNQSSYLYIKGANVKHYVTLAGGANRIGDTKHTFVIRANGSVISKDEGRRFSSLRLAPGDTIVIPEKSFSLSKLRLFLDSGFTSQLGVLAAVLSVLK